MTPKYIKIITAVIVGVAVSAGAAYAVFKSNTVSIDGNKLTTGQATVKLCDTQGTNGWATSISPNLNALGMSPGEERNMLGEREIYIGNDNGQLADVLVDRCDQYSEVAASSTVPMQMVANVSFTDEQCPDPLQSNVKLRFTVNGQDTGYKTLNSWATNTTTVEPLLAPGETGQIQAFAQLSSTTNVQGASCDFAITFTGKQPTT